jgi:YD repeat-containing protein
MGRITSYTYDPADRLAAATDPAGRTTTYSWCSCGALAQVTDPLGHETVWLRDGLNRVMAKEVNGQINALYDYDGSGRLVRRTDTLSQVTTYSYTVDNALAAISYQNAVHPTPGVQFQYDFFYPRLLVMTDGLGTTTYTYNPAGTLGAGQIASIAAPAPNHTLSYQYDVLGRRIGRTLDGISQTVAYDTEDRLATLTSPLGSFAATYDGSSSRMTALSYPNGQGATLSYLDALHDFRLSQLLWGTGGSSFNLSQFNYSYDAAHDQILGLTWHDIDNQTGRFFGFAYDGAKQLLSRLQTTDPTQSPVTVLHTNAFGYDQAGNRTSETIDTTLSTATYDGANQLIAIERGLTAEAQAAMRQARARPSPAAGSNQPAGGHGGPGSGKESNHER